MPINPQESGQARAEIRRHPLVRLAAVSDSSPSPQDSLNSPRNCDQRGFPQPPSGRGADAGQPFPIISPPGGAAPSPSQPRRHLRPEALKLWTSDEHAGAMPDERSPIERRIDFISGIIISGFALAIAALSAIHGWNW
jgi:hypothetical protein